MPLKILFLSYECAPFIKKGGLGDVAIGLPKALKKLGVDIKIVIPKYSEINDQRFRLKKYSSLQFNWGGKKTNSAIYTSKLPQSQVPIYFIKNKYFDYAKIFGYKNDKEKFAFYTQAALKLAEMMNFSPDVLHANDWQTASAIILLNKLKKEYQFFSKTKSLYTIHNLAYQGVGFFDFQKTNLSFGDFKSKDSISNAESQNVNLMREAIAQADFINTVSPAYAREILTPEFGAGLEKILKKRKQNLAGIINGLDDDIFNPQKDKNIKANYSIKSLNKKNKNKTHLQKINKLPLEKNTALLGLVSRLVNQKGLDLLLDIVDELARLNLQLIILGTGEKNIQKKIKEVAQKYPKKIVAHILFDNKLAHQIYAGADMFLMPSRYEPCGLGQIIAMRYGTVPVVRATGGLKDTVKGYANKNSLKRATGFVFEKYDSTELLKAIKKSLKMYYNNKEEWRKLQINGMKQDFSWKPSAKEYLKLYKKII